jgi:hypothetical protein
MLILPEVAPRKSAGDDVWSVDHRRKISCRRCPSGSLK